MSDLLEIIARHEDAIARQWSRDIRALELPAYIQLDDEALLATVRRSCRALLQVMQSGDTASMAQTLRQSAQSRIASGTSYGETVAVWILYRQAVQESLRDQLKAEDTWDQLVDRVDAVLQWVFSVLKKVYQEAG